ncbi:MAG: hypothetical protein Q7N87_00055 [Candidatus Uhrbacteria bacterium]|nr:hypothetical protein [Candidatus Uhrbacteria bacterium]MDP3793697.1 hypothetical protein [Candidatus Uhrbacteria bacterium]
MSSIIVTPYHIALAKDILESMWDLQELHRDLIHRAEELSKSLEVAPLRTPLTDSSNEPFPS